MYMTMTGAPRATPSQSIDGRREAALVVAGEERDGVVDVAVRHRDAGIGEPADAGRDARHDAERNARLDQRQRLLAAAPEDEGIAALQPADALAGRAPAR